MSTKCPDFSGFLWYKYPQMSASLEAGIGSGISSGISSGPSIGASVGSAGEFASIGSFSPEFSNGGQTMTGTSLREMLSMPEVTVDANSFNLDTMAPVPEMAFNNKLYTTIATPQPKDFPNPAVPFADLAEYQVRSDDFISDTVVKENVFNKEIFEVIYQAEQARVEPQDTQKTAVLDEPEKTVDSFKAEDLSPLTNFAAVAHKFKIDFPAAEVEAPHLTGEISDVEVYDNSAFATQIATAENQADSALADEIESFIGENFDTEPKLAAIFQPQLKTALTVQPQEALVNTQTELEKEPREVEMYVDTEILMPKLIKTTVPTEETEQENLVPPLPVKEMRWDVYYIEHKAQKAALALKDRFRRAQKVVQGAFNSYTPDSAEAIRAEASILDEDEKPEDPRIIRFEAPKVAGVISNLTDDQLKKDRAEFEIAKIIEDNAPVVTIAELKGQASLKFIQLPRDAQAVIMERDAEHLIQPVLGGIYDPTQRLPLINMQEIERDDRKTAHNHPPLKV